MQFTIEPAATADNIDAVVDKLKEQAYLSNVALRQSGNGYAIDFEARDGDVLSAVRREVELITGVYTGFPGDDPE